MHECGKGVQQAFSKSMEWHQLAASQESVQAQCQLGVMHQKGLGVTQDSVIALHWYQMAANHLQCQSSSSIGQFVHHKGQATSKTICCLLLQMTPW